MNDSPKYVVSATLEHLEWNNSTVLGYSPEAISSLKQSTDGDLYVSGSGTLVARWWQTGLSTRCTCSCTQSRSARDHDCSAMVCMPSSH